MIHSELIFVKGVRSVAPRFFFLHVDIHLFLNHWLKRLIVALLYYLCSFIKDQFAVFVMGFLLKVMKLFQNQMIMLIAKMYGYKNQ